VDSANQENPATPPPGARTPQAPEVSAMPVQASAGRLSFVSEVPVRLTVELGGTQMRVRDVLALESGSIVELDREVGQPADVRVNGRLIARGEVTVIDEQVAVRIVEVIGHSREAQSI